MKRLAWYGALALLAGVPVQATAADGYVTGDATLRAGPDIDYPAVDMIPAGAPIGIEGCTDGWEWCDVVFNDERGWVAGNFIQDEYDDQPVLVPEYGERLGIPVVSFSIVTYWDHYYVDRPFYRERERWYHRPPPRHAPPPPSHRPWVRPERHDADRHDDDRRDADRHDDDRRDHDRDDRQAAPYQRAQPLPDHAPPYAPTDRNLPRQPAPPRRLEPRPPQPSPDDATPPSHGMPAEHPAQGHAPADRRTDSHHGNPHPSADQDGDDRGH